MLTIIRYPVTSLIAIVVLYLWFRAAMWYLRHKYELSRKTGVVRVAFEAALAPGLILDIIINWTIGGILGYTTDMTLSAKLCHIRAHPLYGWIWQRRFAQWLCEDVLNQWDPTHHHC